MYDPKTEPREFVGQTREEALAKAASFFGVREEELAVVEVDPTQVAGMAARSALVAYLPGQRRAPSEARRDRGRERGGERGGERGRDRGRGRDRDRDRGRGGREGAESSALRGRREGPSRPVEREEPGPEVPSEPSVGTAKGKLGEVGEFVLGLIERMDLGSFEVSETEEGRHRILQVRGPATARLAGGDSRAVDAIQLLANQAAMRLEDERRVVVDVEGDSEARETLLERAAERAAERARSSGRAVALDPMDGRARRIVHMALRDAEGIATMGMGEGRFRQVVVVPEGAPEYEEARQAEAAAARGDEE